MICPHCNQKHPDAAQFCPVTGKEISNQCPNCGKQNQVGSKFCTYCGYSFISAPPGGIPAATPYKQERKIPWLYIGFGAGGVLIIIAGILLFNRNGIGGLLSASQGNSTVTSTPISAALLPSPTVEVIASPTLTQGADTVEIFPISPATSTPIPSPTSTTVSPSNTPLPTEPPPPDLDDLLIAFNSNRTGNNEIFVMNAKGRKVEQLTNSPFDDRVPSWSPNGDEIAFQSNRDGDYEIFIIDIATKNVRQVTSNGCNDYAPAWSPDGGRFAYYSDCDGNREIYVINVDGSSRKKLTQTSNGYNWFPAWSPDGSLITFASNRDGNYHAYVMNSDGSNQAKLARGCVPTFSPDGQYILFSSYCTDDGDLFIMEKDGTNVETLLADQEARNPSWSPYGDSILFQSFLTGVYNIWSLALEDKSLIQISENNSDDSAAVWQPATGPATQSSSDNTSSTAVTSSEDPSEQDVLVIEPYCRRYDQSPIYVNRNQPVRLKWRWDAQTQDLVKDHIDSASYRIMLDGEEITAVDKSTIMYIRDENIYRVEWYSDVMTLTPGRHIGERIVSWDRMISDGWDTYGPGGEFETMWDDCEIIVKN